MQGSTVVDAVTGIPALLAYAWSPIIQAAVEDGLTCRRLGGMHRDTVLFSTQARAILATPTTHQPAGDQRRAPFHYLARLGAEHELAFARRRHCRRRVLRRRATLPAAVRHQRRAVTRLPQDTRTRKPVVVGRIVGIRDCLGGRARIADETAKRRLAVVPHQLDADPAPLGTFADLSRDATSGERIHHQVAGLGQHADEILRQLGRVPRRMRL